MAVHNNLILQCEVTSVLIEIIIWNVFGYELQVVILCYLEVQMDNFAVVEFLWDKSVTVIPSKWILKDGAEVYYFQLILLSVIICIVCARKKKFCVLRMPLIHLLVNFSVHFLNSLRTYVPI